MKRSWFVLVLATALAVSMVQVASAQRRRTRPQADAATASAAQTYANHPLLKFVKKQQHRFVRESWGEQAEECFTDLDLLALRQQIASDEVAKRIRADEEFASVVDALKKTNANERKTIFHAAMQVYRRTWREMGYIDQVNRSGQTEAGQQGDRLVGQLTIDLVRQTVAGLAQGN